MNHKRALSILILVFAVMMVSITPNTFDREEKKRIAIRSLERELASVLERIHQRTELPDWVDVGEVRHELWGRNVGDVLKALGRQFDEVTVISEPPEFASFLIVPESNHLQYNLYFRDIDRPYSASRSWPRDLLLRTTVGQITMWRR